MSAQPKIYDDFGTQNICLLLNLLHRLHPTNASAWDNWIPQRENLATLQGMFGCKETTSWKDSWLDRLSCRQPLGNATLHSTALSGNNHGSARRWTLNSFVYKCVDRGGFPCRSFHAIVHPLHKKRRQQSTRSWLLIVTGILSIDCPTKLNMNCRNLVS